MAVNRFECLENWLTGIKSKGSENEFISDKEWNEIKML
jgi:hypothetical protein